MRARSVPLLVAGLALSVVVAGCGGSGGGGASESRPAPTVVHVSDPVNATSAWTSDHLYVVDAMISIASTLTISPGTLVKFGPGNGLQVESTGTLVANGGSAATPIVFTSLKDDTQGGDTNGDGAATAPAPGDWRGIVIRRSGSVLDHCRVAYGGSNKPYGGALYVAGVGGAPAPAVRITSCTFDHNAGGTLSDAGGATSDVRAAAVNLAGAGVGTVLTGNTFHHNDMPLVIAGTFDVDGSNVFHDPSPGATVTNQYDGIYWSGNYLTTGQRTWSNLDAPFVILQPIQVPRTASLTLASGVVVKLATDERIEADGALLAQGTAAAPIRFTSIQDDVGGDSNGDGAASAAAPGDWRGVVISTDGSVLDRCRFSYGGSAAPYSGALAVTADAAPTITNSTFAYNAGGAPDDNRAAALSLANAGPATTVTGNQFYGNDMPMVVNALVSVDGSNVFHFAPSGAATVTNTYNGIFMDKVRYSVRGDVSWSNVEVPYVIADVNFGVGGSTPSTAGTLTLAAGVVVKLQAATVTLYQGNALNVPGGASSVTFTSFKDDTLLGDTDAAAATPVTGDWQGVDVCTGGPCTWGTPVTMYYAMHP
jgi:hypothetical protein